MPQSTPNPSTIAPEAAVLQRYADAARAADPALCCPTSGAYDAEALALLPPEIIQKDYGCGDPTRHVRRGERVLDLGSGVGKACFLLSHRVGPDGQVIGIDFNDAMLDVARRHQAGMAEKLGHANVRFVKARIQDMALDIDALDGWIQEHPILCAGDLAALELEAERLRARHPAVPAGWGDVVVSNCVLNLVKPQDKEALFREIYRVLAIGGRAVISDIVCDEEPTAAITADPDLWSGCIAGAFREDRFLEAFEKAGFHGIEILERAAAPWQVIDGIEFRSVTVRAFKGKEGPCLERHQAVTYKGPWRQVRDDDGHVLNRGERTAVCDKTFRILTGPGSPHADHVIALPPATEVPIDEARPFDCKGSVRRDPQVSKSGADPTSQQGGEAPRCGPDGCC